MNRNLIFLFVLLVVACAEESRKEITRVTKDPLSLSQPIPVQIDSSKETILDSVFLNLPEIPLYYKRATQPVVFSKVAIAYSRPDTFSDINKVIKFIGLCI